MENIIVSACLLGENCKYSGGNNRCEEVINLKEKYNLIPVCPEKLGGLKIPRLPAEIRNKKVYTQSGKEVTTNFMLGATKVLEIAKKNNCHIAVLKERSPSCGCGEVYDGTFTSKLVKGNGLTAQLLLENDIKIVGESKV